MRIDYLSIAGILIAIAAILGGQLLEGGHLGSLVQATALMIVLGGTLGATLLQSKLSHFVRAMRRIRWVFQTPQHDIPALLADILTWSHLARRGGLLVLESRIEDQTDAYKRKGLQLLVDGAEPALLRQVLENDAYLHMAESKKAAKVWDAAGGYAPTVGILGAVMGLIHVMENLSDPSKLGAGIAVAFVATIYGVGAANLFFLPIASKLKGLAEEDAHWREMYLEGLVCIAQGENPRIIEAKLQAYLTDTPKA